MSRLFLPLLFAALAVTSPELELAADTAAPTSTESLQLDDPVQPLFPQSHRSDAEQDRLEAISLFAAGRMMEHSRDYPGALRMYQRAFRFDESSVTVLREIVPLAFSLNRADEALRYAVKLAEKDSSDAALLRRLAGVLAEQGQYEKAASLYEKVLQQAGTTKNAEQVMLRMEAGRLYFLTKAFAKAADAFEVVQAALEHPDQYGLQELQQKRLTAEGGVAYELFAEAFLEAGRHEDALRAYEKLEKLAPKPAVHAYHRARVAAAREQQDQALKLLEDYFAAKEQSKNADPYRLLAKLLRSSGRESEVISHLSALRDSDPSNPWLSYVLASEYLSAKQYDRAAALYEQLLASKPTVEAYQTLLQIYRARKDQAALLKVLGQGVAKGGSLEPFGSQLEELLKDEALVDEVLKAAQTSNGEADHDPSVYRAAVLLAVQAKKFAAASNFYELAAGRSKPDDLAQVLLVWGVELLRAEKYAEAAAVFQRGIEGKILSDNNPAFHFYLAGALELSGKTDEALAAARHAADKQPKSAQFQSRIGWILYHAKRYDEAIAAYKDLLSKFDKEHSSPDVREAMRDARLILSNLYVLKGDSAQAEEWLQQVLDEFPDDVGASNDLGYLWADGDKHLRLALKMIRRAVKAEPENHAYRDSLGWVLYRLGRYREAKVELEAATVGGDSDGVILEHLAEVQWKLGETALALAGFKRAKQAMESQNDLDPDRAAKLNARIEELERSVATQSHEHAGK